MHIVNIGEAEPFVTKDGSEIRELLAHRNSCIRKQSLAEARVAPGQSTQRHYHLQTEEIYYILQGVGRLHVGDERRDVGPGDAIAIPPGEPHFITNTGEMTLLFLCCCTPGYEHEDTVLLETSPT
jgi:mannose-6-phosphate isomerase-like protein (cupin superfamily)